METWSGSLTWQLRSSRIPTNTGKLKQNMSRYSSSYSPRDRRVGNRSRSPQRRSYESDNCTQDHITVDIGRCAAKALENDNPYLFDILKYKGCIIKDHTEMKFFGSEIHDIADNMMFLFRYLKNEKNIICPR